MNACRKHSTPIIFSADTCPWCEEIAFTASVSRAKSQARRRDPVKGEQQRARAREIYAQKKADPVLYKKLRLDQQIQRARRAAAKMNGKAEE